MSVPSVGGDDSYEYEEDDLEDASNALMREAPTADGSSSATAAASVLARGNGSGIGSIGGGCGSGGRRSQSGGATSSLAVRCDSEPLDVTALWAQAKARAESLCSLFGLPAKESESALVLLAHSRWDEEALVDRWSDAGEAAVRAALGVSGGASMLPLPPPVTNSFGLAFCPVLLEEVPPEDMFALPCGHFASSGAWRLYLLTLLEEPAQGVLGCCLATPCHEALRPSTWERFLGSPRDARALRRFREFFMRNFISGCRDIAACPGMVMEVGEAAVAVAAAAAGTVAGVATPAQAAGAGAGDDDAPLVCYRECEQVVSFPPAYATDVACSHGHVFCFGCKALGGHRPCDCSELADFMKSVGGSTIIGDALFIKKLFSSCPNRKCGLPTERSSGCNKVVCVACRTAYCWVCKRFPYETHHKYPQEAWTCNEPPPAISKSTGDSIEGNEANEALQQWTYERFMHHKENVELLAQPRHVAAFNAALEQATAWFSLSEQQLQVLRGGREALVQAEYTIRASYVRAYYLTRRARRLAAAAAAASAAFAAATATAAADGATAPPSSRRSTASPGDSGGSSCSDSSLSTEQRRLGETAVAHAAAAAETETVLRLFRAQQGQLEGQASLLTELMQPEFIRKALLLPLAAALAPSAPSSSADAPARAVIAAAAASAGGGGSAAGAAGIGGGVAPSTSANALLAAAQPPGRRSEAGEAAMLAEIWQPLSVRVETSANVLLKFAHAVVTFVEDA